MMQIMPVTGGRHDGGPVFVVPTLALRVLWLACILMALDFKGEEAGGLFQISIFLSSCALLAAYSGVLILRRVRFPSRRLQIILHVILVFLASTALTAVLQHVEYGNYIVMIAPYVLFLLGYFFVSGLLRRHSPGDLIPVLLKPLMVMVLISLVWTLFYGFGREGVSLSTVRYHIVSALLPFGIAWVVVTLLCGRRVQLLDIMIAVLVVLTLMIGQTRSYLLVAAVAFLLATYGSSENASSWLGKIIKIAFFSMLLLVVGLMMSDVVRSWLGDNDSRSMLEMWQSRLFASQEELGFDLTTASRLAEYHDQMGRLLASPVNFLLGLGLGASYTYSGDYAEMVASALGYQAIPVSYWNGGHSLFVYTLFSSGVIFGTMFLALILYGVRVSLGNLSLVRRLPLGDRFSFIVVAVAYVGFVTTGFTGFMMGSRPVAMVIGVLLAMVITQNALLRARVPDVRRALA